MPQMGVSVSEGTITKWLKQPGDAIAQDEALLEISTDKVDTEVPSPADGVVSEILIGAGHKGQAGTGLGAGGRPPRPRPPPPCPRGAGGGAGRPPRAPGRAPPPARP